MKTFKDQITELLNSYAETAHYAGSCGELGNSFEAIDSSYIPDIVDGILKIIEPDITGSFEKSVEPAIRYLFKNHNPHTKIHIDYDSAELLMGEMTSNLTKEIPD